MLKKGSATAGTLLVAALAISILFSFAHRLDGVHSAVSGIREVSEPFTSTTAAQNSGVLEWLENFFHPGIRILGPAAGSQVQAETLATANCFDSGAGVSCNGFGSLQEYLAAVRVSEDLGIPIQKLKQKIQEGQSLHEAIQELRPGFKGQFEALRADQQARKILRGFSS